MVKTYLYIPDDLNDEINIIARMQMQSKAEVLRTALKTGVKQLKKKKDLSKKAKKGEIDPGLQVFMKLAEIGKKYAKYNAKNPIDLARNHDKYLWDEYEG